MAVDVGTHTQYEDANSIIEAEILAFAEDIQLGAYEGKTYEAASAPLRPVTRQKFEVGGRGRTSLSGNIGDGVGGGWNNSATATLAMTADAVAVLTVGSILEVGTSAEVVVVKSIDRTGNTITVHERGSGNSSAATHADQATFRVIGHAINDTDAKNVEHIAEQTEKYENYCQLFFVPVEQTEIDRHEDRRFIENMNEQLRREALDKFFRMLSYAMVRGVKRVGTAAIPPMTAGILDQLQDTAGGARTPLRYDVNGSFTEDKLKAALDLAFQHGQPDTIKLSPTNKKVLNPITEQFIRMGKMEAKRAGTDNVLEYEYENVVLKIEQDQAYPNDRVTLATNSQIHKGWKTKDPIRWVEEPKNSSREHRWSYQGNWFAAVRGVGRDHVDMHNIS